MRAGFSSVYFIQYLPVLPIVAKVRDMFYAKLINEPSFRIPRDNARKIFTCLDPGWVNISCLVRHPLCDRRKVYHGIVTLMPP